MKQIDYHIDNKKMKFFLDFFENFLKIFLLYL